ncbi:hypothetical protein D7S86_23050 [Pararobbsia silviterrae]|uniref:Uncharacterized protein n=2 Tax=Pararobbsia silviterrae TaxID=1792498 RepID=A0A494XEX7_9BURK|nr:hypothetical protein D7S86_23050 [Pararobbsia silviterrae]
MLDDTGLRSTDRSQRESLPPPTTTDSYESPPHARDMRAQAAPPRAYVHAAPSLRAGSSRTSDIESDSWAFADWDFDGRDFDDTPPGEPARDQRVPHDKSANVAPRPYFLPQAILSSLLVLLIVGAFEPQGVDDATSHQDNLESDTTASASPRIASMEDTSPTFAPSLIFSTAGGYLVSLILYIRAWLQVRRLDAQILDRADSRSRRGRARRRKLERERDEQRDAMSLYMLSMTGLNSLTETVRTTQTTEVPSRSTEIATFQFEHTPADAARFYTRCEIPPDFFEANHRDARSGRPSDAATHTIPDRSQPDTSPQTTEDSHASVTRHAKTATLSAFERIVEDISRLLASADFLVFAGADATPLTASNATDDAVETPSLTADAVADATPPSATLEHASALAKNDSLPTETSGTTIDVSDDWTDALSIVNATASPSNQTSTPDLDPTFDAKNYGANTVFSVFPGLTFEEIKNVVASLQLGDPRLARFTAACRRAHDENPENIFPPSHDLKYRNRWLLQMEFPSGLAHFIKHKFLYRIPVNHDDIRDSIQFHYTFSQLIPDCLLPPQSPYSRKNHYTKVPLWNHRLGVLHVGAMFAHYESSISDKEYIDIHLDAMSDAEIYELGLTVIRGLASGDLPASAAYLIELPALLHAYAKLDEEGGLLPEKYDSIPADGSHPLIKKHSKQLNDEYVDFICNSILIGPALVKAYEAESNYKTRTALAESLVPALNSQGTCNQFTALQYKESPDRCKAPPQTIAKGKLIPFKPTLVSVPNLNDLYKNLTRNIETHFRSLDEAILRNLFSEFCLKYPDDCAYLVRSEVKTNTPLAKVDKEAFARKVPYLASQYLDAEVLVARIGSEQRTYLLTRTQDAMGYTLFLFEGQIDIGHDSTLRIQYQGEYYRGTLTKPLKSRHQPIERLIKNLANQHATLREQIFYTLGYDATAWEKAGKIITSILNPFDNCVTTIQDTTTSEQKFYAFAACTLDALILIEASADVMITGAQIANKIAQSFRVGFMHLASRTFTVTSVRESFRIVVFNLQKNAPALLNDLKQLGINIVQLADPGISTVLYLSRPIAGKSSNLSRALLIDSISRSFLISRKVENILKPDCQVTIPIRTCCTSENRNIVEESNTSSSSMGSRSARFIRNMGNDSQSNKPPTLSPPNRGRTLTNF